MVYRGRLIQTRVYQSRSLDWVKEARVYTPHGEGWNEQQIFGETTAPSEELAKEDTYRLAKKWIDLTIPNDSLADA